MESSPGIKVLDKEQTKTIFGNSAVEQLSICGCAVMSVLSHRSKGGYGKNTKLFIKTNTLASIYCYICIIVTKLSLSDHIYLITYLITFGKW